MPHDPIAQPDRRTFLRAGAVAAASASAGLAARGAAAQEENKPAPLPRRPLGKTGVEVTILNQGGIRGPALDRVLRTSYANGVRMFDAAKVYGSEPNFKRWFEQAPEVRKEIFLVTKDMPRSGAEMKRMVDERLQTLGTDYIDLFFLHGLGDQGVDAAIKLVRSQEFKDAADAIRKSGKARLIGFSTHHKERAAIIQAAAEAGSVDAIMLMYNPWVAAEAPLNRALDTCWKKGIGLISMKQIAGKFFGDRGGPNNLEKIAQQLPDTLKERGLSPYQALLHAIWTDERISAVCTSMRNLEQIRENTDAARRFEPLKVTEIQQLRDAVIACGPTLCADCDGRCSVAAGTTAELGSLTRFLTYHEHHGDRAEARRQYAQLTAEARDWKGADLEAARLACPNKLDFARLLPRADELLA
jgi:aryl-alcohol dehydrogenase-like predicted oxidoreductase